MRLNAAICAILSVTNNIVRVEIDNVLLIEMCF